MEHIFVDTSAWYALFNASDPAHDRVKKFIENNSLPLATSNFITTEVLNLLVARRQKRMALAFGESLREGDDATVFHINGTDEDDAWKLFQKYKDQEYSFTDCTSFVLMRRLRIEKALALDDDFVAMGFTLVTA